VVRAELVDVVHGWQLWGHQFVRQREDVLTLEDEIARKISATLQPRLTGEQPSSWRGGRPQITKPTTSTLSAGILRIVVTTRA
jgi:hypothetical protein